MAIYRTGALVGALSGPLGGVVFVNAKHANVVRHRPAVNHKSSPFLGSAQGRMQNIRIAWAELTTLQQTAWQTTAALVPTVNRLGETSPLSGFQYFVRVNLLARTTSEFPIVDAPTEGVAPPPTDITADFSEAGLYTIAGDPPTGQGLTQYYLYGWPFFTTNESRSPARLVFLRTESDFSFSVDVRDEWIEHFGPLQEDQQFAVGVAAVLANHSRSQIIELREQTNA